MRKAVVVFSGRVDKAWQRLLKPGVKHCSLIIEDGPSWLLIEPLSSCLQVRAIGSVQTNIAARLRDAGFTVVETMIETSSTRAAPLGLWTCVETVKRGLGLRAGRILTPWQLFCFLEQKRKISVDNGYK